jgi:hypothetical protein
MTAPPNARRAPEMDAGPSTEPGTNHRKEDNDSFQNNLQSPSRQVRRREARHHTAAEVSRLFADRVRTELPKLFPNGVILRRSGGLEFCIGALL